MKNTLVIFLFLPLFAFSQLTDNFDDGDFTVNPAWTGSDVNFLINSSLQLQLNANEAGTSYLSTPWDSQGTIEWHFYIKLAFSPSSANFARAYLSATSADLSGSPEGYFLQFGESGSSDAIELFKKQGSQITSICRGTEGQLANSFALWIKVVRTTNGGWTVFSDPSGTGSYSQEATGSDNTFQPGGFFGFYGQYTSSNITKMYFDDIYAGNLIIDNTPPHLTGIQVTDPFSLGLTFSESTEFAGVTNVLNYTVDGDIDHPATAIIGANTSQVNLQFTNYFENGRINTLTICNISDISGNIMADTTVQFSYYEAGANEVVINEIMADPGPMVGLPEWEYLELYNTTDNLIDLSGWKLIIGESEKLIGSAVIGPNSFLILCHEDAITALSGFGPVAGFSSFQLTNAGTNLKLLSNKGIVISGLTYSDTWYNDNTKKDGGWSLEQIDPTNSCAGKNNWTASTASMGGTPGSLNSVNASNNAPPKPARFTLLTDNIIQLWFDQQMDEVSVSNTAFYELNPGNIVPSSALLNETEPEFVQLVFDQVFEVGTIYTLHISSSVLNCAGIEVADGTNINFGIPNPVAKGEIIINEVLFNPLGEGVDYVEIYNMTDKIFDIEQLILGSVRQTIPNPPDTTLKPISETSRLLLPESYILLSVSTSTVLSQYTSPDADNFVEMPSFPTYSNDAGTVLLKSETGEIIDVFNYTDSMHFPLLTTTEGVSLERISFDEPTVEAGNWHSAAETVGFGTPGYKNSMFNEIVQPAGEITIEPSIFSPDSDGKDDIMALVYRFDQPGFTFNAFVFDANGNQIRHLVKSTLVPATGSFFWDGVDESGNKVPVGIYVITVEVFNPEGKVENYKKAVVVGVR